MKAIVIYWSNSGNTEKVAKSIKEGLDDAGANVELMKSDEADGIDFLDYDLVCVGSPSYQWLPPKPMQSFLNNKFSEYHKLGRIQLAAPEMPRKYALIFCTYSGPHTGINEAIPVGKYVGQFFDHLGFKILDEWYILSEFHGSVEMSTKGRMGDIRGKPNEVDLDKIKQNIANLVRGI
ncbi:MAG: flavodoxin domain-containing protein [Spirochaetota bacterium]|nr:flavodoxin domain-containing protein [Spirochaetota bacterium]